MVPAHFLRITCFYLAFVSIRFYRNWSWSEVRNKLSGDKLSCTLPYYRFYSKHLCRTTLRTYKHTAASMSKNSEDAWLMPLLHSSLFSVVIPALMWSLLYDHRGWKPPSVQGENGGSDELLCEMQGWNLVRSLVCFPPLCRVLQEHTHVCMSTALGFHSITTTSTDITFILSFLSPETTLDMKY